MTPSDDNVSLVHDTWITTMNNLAEQTKDPTIRELAYFCAEVLENCGHTRALREFLDERARQAFANERGD